VDLDAMSEAQLERLYVSVVRLASMDDTVLAALVEHLLSGEEFARTYDRFSRVNRKRRGEETRRGRTPVARSQLSARNPISPVIPASCRAREGRRSRVTLTPPHGPRTGCDREVAQLAIHVMRARLQSWLTMSCGPRVVSIVRVRRKPASLHEIALRQD
jgi:hypothetical protein